MIELVTTDKGAQLLTDVALRIARSAPIGTKCIFLNCEMHDTPGGMTLSDNLFSVVKFPLLRPKKVIIDMDADTFASLTALGREVIKQTQKQHLILDLLINSKGTYRAFQDDGPLRRLGGDRFYSGKHKTYTDIEPCLGGLE